MKLLIKQGVEAATKFKDHFKIKAVGPSELQQQLATAKFKLGQLLTLDQAAFATEIEVARAEIATLEDRLGTAADVDGLSVDHAPGMESGLLSKMTAILSRHQKAMAREGEEHQQLVMSLEAQVAELQLQISTAQRQHMLQSATNEELLVAFQVKVDALTTTPPPTNVTEAQSTDAQLQQQLGKRLTTEWLQLNGLAGISEASVAALMVEFTGALLDAGPTVTTTLLAPISTSSGSGTAEPKPATLGERKRNLGKGASGSWADDTMGVEDEL